MNNNKKRKKIIFDIIIIIIILFTVMLYGFITKDKISIEKNENLLSVILLLISFLFLLSYFVPNASYITHICIWLGIHSAGTRKKNMSLVYFIFFLVFSIMIYIS